jgi:crotonobetainyl-CoA:carnitine CoA-transferase CaiB-like acyl-CoA transferase
MSLGDLGARVIKVEEPGFGDETRHWGPPFIENESAYFLSLNRNKESIELDLKQERGREALRRLAREADVVVQNFRPGVMDVWELAMRPCAWKTHGSSTRLFPASDRPGRNG